MFNTISAMGSLECSWCVQSTAMPALLSEACMSVLICTHKSILSNFQYTSVLRSTIFSYKHIVDYGFAVSIAAGLVQAKTGALSEERVSAFGMLTPRSGVAALQSLLYGLTSATVPRAAGVRGAATQTYWRLLITKFKPLPPLFAQIALPLDDPEMVCCP